MTVLSYANRGATSLFSTAPDLALWFDSFRTWQSRRHEARPADAGAKSVGQGGHDQLRAERFICDQTLRQCYGLTNREIQVARLLADRHSNKEIADQLDITVYTAGRHTERVLKKLGVTTRRDVRAKLKE